MERSTSAPAPATTAQPGTVSAARLRLAAIHGPAEPPQPTLPGIPLSEAITAHHRADRPTWATALADRLPPTLRGRWGIEARAAVALAGVALAGAVGGGWYLWQSQPTVIDLPGGRDESGPHADRIVAAAGIGGENPGSDTGPAAVPHPPPVPVASQVSMSLSAAPFPPPFPQSPAGSGTRSPGAGMSVVVDVAGKVARPGVQSLPAGSRVYEALKAAGGAAPDVDLTGLDLARLLVDGEQLRVGLPGLAAPSAIGPSPGAVGGSKGKHGKPAQPVNLNTAALAELETIPDIGPAMAQRILDWRTQHGRFTSVAQLRQVRGIGERKFADLKDSVTV